MRSRNNKMADETRVNEQEGSNSPSQFEDHQGFKQEFSDDYRQPDEYPEGYYQEENFSEHNEDFPQEKGPLKRERSWPDDDSSFSKRPPFNINTNMPSTLRVLMRSLDAGGIIGKGGENIKRLRKKYDCQVQLPDSAGNPERVLTVVGKQSSCIGVFTECLQKVINEIKRRDSKAPVEIQVLIPQPFMGTIIGTGGTKIKDLRKRTGATIKIFSEPMPYSNERSISLSGTEEQIVNSVEFFLQEIGQREPKEPIILYDPALPPDYPPDYGYPPPPPPQYGGRYYGGGGGGRRGGGGGRGNYGGRGRGRFNPPAPPPSSSSYSNSGPSGGTQEQKTPPIAPPNNSQPTPAPPLTTPPTQDQSSQGPPSTVQYPQSSQQSSSGTSSYPSQQYGTSSTGNDYYSNTSYNQASSQGTQPPPTSTSYPPTNYQSSYSNYQAPNYGGGTSYQQTPPTAPPTGYSQQSYQQYSAQPAPLVPPPTQTNYSYGGSGQYTQQQTSMFPSAVTMATGNYPAGSTSKQVTIPSSYAGSILGQNGARIQQIRSQSQCSVTIDDVPPGAVPKDRIITIVGTPANIAIAEELMKDSVRMEHHI